MMGHHGLDGYPPWDTIWLKEDLWTGAMEAKKKKPASNSFQKNHQSRTGLKKTKENKNRTAWNRTD